MRNLDDDKRDDSDVALIQGKTPDGEGLRVIRKRRERIELAHVRPLAEGVPITGEVVTLKPRPEFPLLCDVKTELEAPAAADVATRPAHGGPAQVATDRYRENWDKIWKRKREPELPS
ncbi:MAG TPA: hypothetical protein VMS65_00965 [Polyangiaceae bacterium]|nr:hypothetical protein [Polyangiaceae bacterium]